MGLPVEQIFKNSILCSLHFDKDCFVHSSELRGTLRKRLKLDAVPSIRNIFHNEIKMKNEANVTKNNESVVTTETKMLEENKLTSDKNVKMEINVDSEKNESDENVTKVLTEGTSINSISSNENEILKKCFDSENTSDNSERDMRVVMEKMSKSSDGNEMRKRSQDFDTSLKFSGRLKKIKNVKWDDILHSLPLCKIYFEEAQDVIADLEKKLKSKGHRKCLEKRVKLLNSMLQVMKNRKLLTEKMATKLEVNER